MDERIVKLANNLVDYSVKVKENEKVLISASGTSPHDLVRCLVKKVYENKAFPYVALSEPRITREILLNCSLEQLEAQNKWDLEKMKEMDCYIGIGGGANASEFNDVPSEKMQLHNKIMSPTQRERVDNSKWVILRYPNPSLAQSAKMSQDAFEEYFFKVCNLDYSKMAKAMEILKERMERTDKVRVTGKNTDLTFSIKGIPVIPCAGEMNIPDGEIFTAPIKDSVNGKITYNTPSDYMGFTYENICLEFKDGKIINATANDSKRLNTVLDTDEGSRYIGEFAIGVNPYINEPMRDTLFDEKIAGSFHFTPGNAYEEANNSNKSVVHWDLVFIQTKEYGGGEIYFDDELIRKDGMFVPEYLHCLNPENLK